MLSVETELKLANIFLALAKGEKSIEINRQVLGGLEHFDPYKIFSYLDKQKKNHLNSLDLLNYLKERGISVDEFEIKLIILFYDRDYDGVLSYKEFANLIQSDFSQNKNNFNSLQQNRIIDLPYNIDQGLRQLLTSEDKLDNTIISLLNDLKARYDFNIHDLYHSVKNWNYIEENSLRNFLGRNKISYLESDIRKILKRLDLNGDGKVDLCEFHAFLGFPICQFCCPNDACNYCGVCYCDLCLCDVHCFIHNCIHHKYINKQNNIQKNIIKNNITYHEKNNIIYQEENNLNLNNIQNQINKIKPVQIPPSSKERSKTPSMHYNNESSNLNAKKSIQNKKIKNIFNLEDNRKLNNNYKNNLNFNNYKNMKFSNQEDIQNYNFDYKCRYPSNESSNTFVGPVSDNLYLRFSPKRKYSPKSFNCNSYYSNPCLTNDYCCNFIYQPEPCEKCINNHCNHFHKENSSIYSNINNNQYASCKICNNFPCCCCSICHNYPCKCCDICHSLQCKCCPKCHTFPCKCCKVCHFPECICCKNCKKYPCKCCPVCHLEECCCCKNCKKYPCECCPKCHFPNCRCCTVCNNYPCSCCSVCHMAKCICCPRCKTYPCRCCPDCNFVNCQCCVRCGCYPCKCCDPRCNCSQMCGNLMCQNCKNNPCICCPYCNFNPSQCHGCICGKECVAMSLNALNSLNCPVHNVHTMKHNPGCPFGAKCPHGPKCAHPKDNNSQNNINQNINNQNNNNPNNFNNNSYINNQNNPNNNNNYQNNNSPNNSNNNSYINNQNNNPDNNNYQNNQFPPNQNRMNKKNITYTYSHPNNEQSNNIPDNNNFYDNNDQNNNNGPNYIKDPYYNNGPNNNNGPFNNNGPNNNNGPFNNNGPNNNFPYNDNNNRNPPFQDPNNNNNQNPNENNPNNQNPNENNPNNQNQNNPNITCPLSPISSAYPPDSPFFNLNEPGQKSNWIFCPKCNVYHRCPHPGCEHNPNKRTTTHKCLQDDNDNQNNSNRNNNFGPNNNRVPNRSQMNTSQSRRSKSNRKRDVFSSCPYQEELAQFVDFLGYLMEVESKIEDLKIELARRDDFNFEDIFRIFEVDGKGYIEPEDLKQGLKLLGLNPSDFDIRLLMKRFDLNQQGLLSYTDFFDMVVSFEKKMRNSVQIRPPNSCCSCKSPDVFECDTLIAIKNLFKFIIDCENDINQMRADFDSLRSKYSDVVQFLDVSRRGIINRSDLKLYLTQFNKFTTSKECDLLFIRLDKTRSGEVGIDEIENELMFLR